MKIDSSASKWSKKRHKASMAHNNKNGIYKRNSLDEWTCCGKANEKRIKNSFFSSCNIARRLICISNNSQQSVVWGWWVSDVMRWFIGVYRGVKQKTTKEPRMRLCLLLSSLLLRQQWMIPCGNNVMIPWRVFWIIIKTDNEILLSFDIYFDERKSPDHNTHSDPFSVSLRTVKK